VSRDPKEKGCWVWVALSISLGCSSMCSWTCFVFCRKEEGYGTAPTFNVSIIMGKRDEPLLVACARQLIEHIRFAFYSFVMHFLLVVCRFLLALVELSWIKYLMVSSKDFWHSNSMMFEYYNMTKLSHYEAVSYMLGQILHHPARLSICRHMRAWITALSGNICSIFKELQYFHHKSSFAI
jgi:hypothetical protein